MLRRDPALRWLLCVASPPLVSAAFTQPGWAVLPDERQDAAMPGHPSRVSAAGGAPRDRFDANGLKRWGVECVGGAECGSGLCCSSCSADVGSCMCPCENNPRQNGPWNGQWPVATCCCATVAFSDTCAAEGARDTLLRGGHCNPGTGVDDVAAALRAPPAPPRQMAARWVSPRRGPGGGRLPTLLEAAAAARDDAAAQRLLPFGAMCQRWSQCGSGICATGCDCDNARLAVPQPCSCNCVTPSARARSPAGEWGAKTCGAFFVGGNPCRQACPPCSAEECDAADAAAATRAAAGAGAAAAPCRFACTTGTRRWECSMYPSYWLNAAAAGCGGCCNTNFCPVPRVPHTDPAAVSADAAAAFASASQLRAAAPLSRRGAAGLTRGELRGALRGGGAGGHRAAARLRRLLRLPTAAPRLLDAEDVLEGVFGALDLDGDQFITAAELRDGALARRGAGPPGHPAGLRGGWTAGAGKGGEDVWTADTPPPPPEPEREAWR